MEASDNIQTTDALSSQARVYVLGRILQNGKDTARPSAHSLIVNAASMTNSRFVIAP